MDVTVDLPTEDLVELAKISIELDRSVNWIMSNCLKLYINKQERKTVKKWGNYGNSLQTRGRIIHLWVFRIQ